MHADLVADNLCAFLDILRVICVRALQESDSQLQGLNLKFDSLPASSTLSLRRSHRH